MSLYSNIRNLWKRPDTQLKEIFQNRFIEWRNTTTIVRVERPTRLDRARSLGYKAKQGYLIVRVRLKRSKRQRPLIKKGRRSKHRRRKKVVNKSYQWIAEERGNKKFPNCEVIGSYWLGQDGRYNFFEIILVDREITSRYPETAWIKNNRGRTFRGITSAGRKSRGLTNKGKGAEKLRSGKKAKRKN